MITRLISKVNVIIVEEIGSKNSRLRRRNLSSALFHSLSPPSALMEFIAFGIGRLASPPRVRKWRFSIIMDG